jgi:hypothetical protein
MRFYQMWLKECAARAAASIGAARQCARKRSGIDDACGHFVPDFETTLAPNTELGTHADNGCVGRIEQQYLAPYRGSARRACVHTSMPSGMSVYQPRINGSSRPIQVYLSWGVWPASIRELGGDRRRASSASMSSKCMTVDPTAARH